MERYNETFHAYNIHRRQSATFSQIDRGGARRNGAADFLGSSGIRSAETQAVK